MKASTIATRIAESVYDDDLPVLEDALRARRDHLRTLARAEARATFKIGDRARIKLDAALRPGYIMGEPCEIKRVDFQKALVDFDRPLGRNGRYHTSVKVPLDCLELVA